MFLSASLFFMLARLSYNFFPLQMATLTLILDPLKYIENGIIVWDNGKIDIGTDSVYNNSYEYEQEEVI